MLSIGSNESKLLSKHMKQKAGHVSILARHPPGDCTGVILLITES